MRNWNKLKNLVMESIKNKEFDYDQIPPDATIAENHGVRK